jgi:hypothetical protein
VHIYAPSPRLISGDHVLLEALARSASGDPLDSAQFTWTSAQPAIVTVDSNGLAMARGLGVATITATSSGVRGSIQLQVLPASVEIQPARNRISVGENLVFTAIARDIHGESIPGVAFRWQVSSSQSAGTSNAVINNTTGAFTANATGVVMVRAVIPYSVNQSRFMTQYQATMVIEIARALDYRVTPISGTGELRTGLALRPAPAGTRLSVNELGQLAFTAGLDGLTSGLLLHQSGKFELLASTGSPTTIAGGVVSLLFPPALNNRGEALTETQSIGGGSGLMLATRRGASTVLFQGQSTSGFFDLRGFQPFALNDEGEFVFRATFRFPDQATTYTGVFKRLRSGLELIWSTATPLPGLTGATNIVETGIDNTGTVWFIADAAGRRGLYRRQFADAEKMLATGDPFNGTTVNTLSNLSVSTDGTAGVRVNSPGGIEHVARFRNGRQDSLRLSSWRGILSAANGGALLFFGSIPSFPAGLYRWPDGGAELRHGLGTSSPDGTPIRNVLSAAMNSSGRIWAAITTDRSDFLLMEDPGPSTLAKAGSSIDVSAPLTLFRLLAGAASGPPHLLTGSNPGSLYRLNGAGYEPLIIFGERLTGGQSFNGTYQPVESPSGEVCFADRYGYTYRARDGQIVRLNRDAGDGVTPFVDRLIAINARGVSLQQASTNRSHSRLFLLEGEKVKVIATNGTAAPYITSIASGGSVAGWNGTFSAIDDRGRVLAFLTLRDGPSGLYLFENDAWRPVMIPNVDTIHDVVVTGFPSAIKSDGSKFYSALNLLGGGSTLASFDGRQWLALASRGEAASTGGQIFSVGAVDVNRRGETAFLVTFNGGQRALLFSDAKGMRTVHLLSDAITADNYLVNLFDVTLRDDRTVYFTGIDLADRYMLYRADPLF